MFEGFVPGIIDMRPQVVIIGGGFGGLACARGLARANADVKLVDRRNFHLFQPLLYQVATGALSPANIASPLRSILRRQRNAQVLLAEVADFDCVGQRVLFEDGQSIPYDYLVLAAGATHHYFGQDAVWEPLAPGLKTIEDATEIRRKILSAFESAERTEDFALRAALLTFVVVGGGPTGIEMAGAICELSRHTLRNDFRSINPATARVILIENSPGVLNNFHVDLGEAAKKSLIKMGAEVWNDTRLSEIHADHAIVTQHGKQVRIDTHNVIWAAGVKGTPLNAKLVAQASEQALLDRAGRVIVNKACTIPVHHNIFVIGDAAAFVDENGKQLPGVAPVAMQQGKYVADVIAGDINGTPIDDGFRYLDKGNMATIGRSHAVVESGPIRFSGRIAWLAWLFIHILYLARFENRLLVMMQWFWNYVTRNRAARLITNDPNLISED
jgi:NADH:ubiquinone reductase (H+-translocating)